MKSWNDLIRERILKLHEDPSTLVTTLTKDELNEEFDEGYGIPEGKPFTAWTTNYVYFPIAYDGKDSVGYAPRNPCDIVMEHQGGGTSEEDK